MRQAEEKLEESKQLAESAMYTVLSNDVGISGFYFLRLRKGKHLSCVLKIKG